jgi:hypothetical protein
MGVRLIGVTKKKEFLWPSWSLPSVSKRNEANFTTISTDSFRLLVAHMPRCRELAIFVLTETDRQTDRQTDCFTPRAG